MSVAIQQADEALQMALAAMRAAADEMAGRIEGLSDGELVGEAQAVAELSRQVDALRWAVVREVEARGRGVPAPESIARKAGFRNPTLLLATLFGVATGAAGAWLRLCEHAAPRYSFTAGQLPPLRTALAGALEAGAVTLDQASMIDRTLPSPAGPEFAAGLHEAAELALVAAAQGMTPEQAFGGAAGNQDDDGAGERDAAGASGPEAGGNGAAGHWSLRHAPHLLKAQAEAWAGAIDPDGLEPSAAEQHRRRCFTMHQLPGGGWKFSGYATAKDGAALQTVFDAYQAPRSQSARNEANGAGGGAVAGPSAAGPSEVEGPGLGRAGVSGVVAAAAGGMAATAAGAGERRTREQIAYDVLIALFEAHARGPEAPKPGGSAPTLLITATIEALQAHLRGEAEAGFVPAHRAAATGGAGVAEGAGVAGAAGGAGGGGAAAVPAGGIPAAGRAGGAGVAGSSSLQAELERRFLLPSRGEVPLPASTVSRMLCNDSLQLLIEDEHGHPLKLGREHRLFSPHQRRVLLARDRTCRAPGCGFPGGWCEAHHVTPWSHGGPSDVDQGLLLCSFHHHEVHEGRLSIEADPSVAGGRTPWRVVSPIPGWIR
jgi:hypothetical protein